MSREVYAFRLAFFCNVVKVFYICERACYAQMKSALNAIYGTSALCRIA